MQIFKTFWCSLTQHHNLTRSFQRQTNMLTRHHWQWKHHLAAIKVVHYFHRVVVWILKMRFHNSAIFSKIMFKMPQRWIRSIRLEIIWVRLNCCSRRFTTNIHPSPHQTKVILEEVQVDFKLLVYKFYKMKIGIKLIHKYLNYIIWK